MSGWRKGLRRRPRRDGGYEGGRRDGNEVRLWDLGKGGKESTHGLQETGTGVEGWQEDGGRGGGVRQADTSTGTAVVKELPGSEGGWRLLCGAMSRRGGGVPVVLLVQMPSVC